MNNQKLLIREAHDDNKVMDDFISRKDFINRTGIFVTYDYFHDFVYDEFKEAGLSVDEYVDTFEEKHRIEITEFSKEFKHMALYYDIDSFIAYSDEDVVCFPECYEFMDIIDARSAIWRENYEDEYKKNQELFDIAEKCMSIIDECRQIIDELVKKCELSGYIETELIRIADIVKSSNIGLLDKMDFSHSNMNEKRTH